MSAPNVGSQEWWDALGVDEKGRIRDVLRRKTIDQIILAARLTYSTEDVLASVLPFMTDEQLRAIHAAMDASPENNGPSAPDEPAPSADAGSDSEPVTSGKRKTLKAKKLEVGSKVSGRHRRGVSARAGKVAKK